MADRYLLLLLLFLYINCIFVGLQRKQESKEKAQKDTYYDDERRNGESNTYLQFYNAPKEGMNNNIWLMQGG